MDGPVRKKNCTDPNAGKKYKEYVLEGAGQRTNEEVDALLHHVNACRACFEFTLAWTARKQRQTK